MRKALQHLHRQSIRQCFPGSKESFCFIRQPFSRKSFYNDEGDLVKGKRKHNLFAELEKKGLLDVPKLNEEIDDDGFLDNEEFEDEDFNIDELSESFTDETVIEDDQDTTDHPDIDESTSTTEKDDDVDLLCGFDGDIDAVDENGIPLWEKSYNLLCEKSRSDEEASKAKSSKPIARIDRVAEIDEKGRAYGTGRRKTSVARVWVKLTEQPCGQITVNKKDITDHFPLDYQREELLKPFQAINELGKFEVWCTVKGGGLSGQAGAIRHGISRALEKFNPEYRPALKAAGYLTRDPRMVERKKPGQPKARKKFQWVKR